MVCQNILSSAGVWNVELLVRSSLSLSELNCGNSDLLTEVRQSWFTHMSIFTTCFGTELPRCHHHQISKRHDELFRSTKREFHHVVVKVIISLWHWFTVSVSNGWRVTKTFTCLCQVEFKVRGSVVASWIEDPWIFVWMDCRFPQLEEHLNRKRRVEIGRDNHLRLTRPRCLWFADPQGVDRVNDEERL